MAELLMSHQKEAVSKMKNGCVLVGGVGSGKSRTALAYYDSVQEKRLQKLIIITTAKKRDDGDWFVELIPFRRISIDDAIVDSWNNIQKYKDVQDAFFIFDEQRVSGRGAWVKSFIKISKRNNWILLSATPGDTWSDYIPVFIANGFYRNRTEFENEHVMFVPGIKFPKVYKYYGISKLTRLRDKILVDMPMDRHTIPHKIDMFHNYDIRLYKAVVTTRWNPYTDLPITNASELVSVLRRIVNEDESKQSMLCELLDKHDRIIVFYNYNYERDILLHIAEVYGIEIAEWNGFKHQEIPKNLDKWIYIVQYNAGNEGWNCITTDTIVFWSMNYSYRIMVQAMGRIDRMNTPFIDLYYYFFRSKAPIDLGIKNALTSKKKFNESRYVRKLYGADFESGIDIAYDRFERKMRNNNN